MHSSSLLNVLLLLWGLSLAQSCSNDLPPIGQWTWKGCNSTPYWPQISMEISSDCPQPRYQAASWSNGTHFHIYGGIGPGEDVESQPSGILNDHWAFEFQTQEWHVIYSTGIPNQHGVYGIKNIPDPLNRPGSRREAAVWSKGSVAYIFGGFGFAKNGNGGYLNDLWTFDSETEIWTWISGFDIINSDDSEYQIGARAGSVAWTNGENSLWLFSGFGVFRNDETGFELHSRNDMWRYDLQKGWFFIDGHTKFNAPLYYQMKGRTGALLWKDNNGTVWLYGGYNHLDDAYLSDIWSWNQTHTRWTLQIISPPNRKSMYNRPKVLSDKAHPSSRCCAMTWVDSNNNMFLYGGYGIRNHQRIFLDDVWAMRSNEDYQVMWADVKKPSDPNTPLYGDINAIDPLIWPGKRAYASYFYSSTDDTLWMFGAIGINDYSIFPKRWVYYQDLWTYKSPEIYTELSSHVPTPWYNYFIIAFILLELVAIFLLILFILWKRRYRHTVASKGNGGENPLASSSSDLSMNNCFNNFDWTINRKELKFGSIIGSGSSGIIYKGKWRGQYVAIKKLLEDRLVGEREGAIREAQLVVGLRPHLNVIRILGVCITHNDVFIVMNLMHTSLDKLIYERNIKFETKQVYKIVRGIVAGMVHLENENICHRDLAARNICLDKDWTPAITDFGMSRKVMSSKEGKTLSQMGPVAWMAPECFKQIYSSKSDVWSFGCLLYEILAGKPPHSDASDLFELAVKIRDENLKPKIESGWDETFVKIMSMCWRSAPEERPSFRKISKILDKRIDFLEASEECVLYNDPSLAKSNLSDDNVDKKQEAIEEAYVDGFLL